jgi:hypothetical protein
VTEGKGMQVLCAPYSLNTVSTYVKQPTLKIERANTKQSVLVEKIADTKYA